MGGKPRVDRSPEAKWQIVQEGIKSGNVSETCPRYGIAQTLYNRWKDEAEQGAKVIRITAEKRVTIISKQVNNYRLSDKSGSSWSADSSQPGYGKFCYGNRKVTSIDNSRWGRTVWEQRPSM